MIKELKKTAIKQDVALWKRVATDLEKPTKKRRIVNLSRISNYAKENETVIVPGKVLALGELDKKVVIAAYTISKQAEDKIKANGSKFMTIPELLKKNPKGSKVRIIG